MGWLTIVYIVGHNSTFRGARKYILSMTKVHIVEHESTSFRRGGIYGSLSLKKIFLSFIRDIVSVWDNICLLYLSQ